jgi:hypothetical protein
VWYRKEKEYSMYTSVEWSCRKDEYHIDEKRKVHAQCCWLGQELWEEEVGKVCYMVNQSPSSILYENTPHEVCTGKKLSRTHFMVFGYDSYVNVPKQNKSNLDKKDD